MLVQSCAVEWEDATIRPTVSIGVATSRAGESGQELLARADANLYLAKQGGRNQFRAV